MSLNCPSGGTNERMLFDSHGRNRTQGWNLTSFRMEGFANESVKSGRPERWEFTSTSPYISHFTSIPSLSTITKWVSFFSTYKYKCEKSIVASLCKPDIKNNQDREATASNKSYLFQFQKKKKKAKLKVSINFGRQKGMQLQTSRRVIKTHHHPLNSKKKKHYPFELLHLPSLFGKHYIPWAGNILHSCVNDDKHTYVCVKSQIL